MALARFGVFELDTDAGELRRQGRLVRLTGQPLKALELLVSRPGQIVTRDELRRHIWNDSRFVDFDRSLNFCIAVVRDALGDSARSPRFVETLPRRGYRFIGDVSRTQDNRRTEVEKTEEWKRAARSVFRLPSSVVRYLPLAAAIPLLIVQAPSPNPAHTRTTAAPEALAAFEQGVAERHDGKDGWRRSIYRFREATRLDPRFAEAHYALADTYLDLADSRTLPPEAALTQARDAAERAVALEDMAETRTILGSVRLLEDWDWAGARREFARSIALDPSHDGSLVAYARFLSAAGEHTRAIEIVDRAEALSPSCDLVYWESALIRYRAHRGAEALAKARLSADLGPPGGVDADLWRIRIQWLTLLIHVDQREWALAAGDASTIGATRVDDADGVRAFVLAAAKRAGGITDSSRRPVWTATLYAIAGDDEAALTWLERAAGERDPDILFGLRNPAFDGLRPDERFHRIATATGLPDGGARRATRTARASAP